MRFELTTFSLATKCSTPELHPHMVIVFMFGGDNRDRTDDLLNANQSLSQLSYIPKKGKNSFTSCWTASLLGTICSVV